MASFQDHIQYLIKHSLARTNRFQVIIPLPRALQDMVADPESDNERGFAERIIGTEGVKIVKSFLGGGTEITRGLDVMVESTDIPGKNLTTTEIKYNGDFYKIPYSVVYETQQFMFKCSRDMYEKNIMDEWMNLIFDPTKHEIAYMDDYATDITINQLNEQDQIVYSVILKDSFPIMCAPMTVSNEDKDTYARLQCQFMYRRWIRADDNINDADGVSSLTQTPLGPIVAPFLSNPAVQRALDTVKNQTGLDLEGEAVNIYNGIDNIVKSTTGSSINRSASLLEGMKAQIGSNGKISADQKGKLIGKIDDILSNLRG